MRAIVFAAAVVAAMAVSSAGFASSTVVSFYFAGVGRSSVLHVPANYDASKAYPLMLVFHGTGSTGAGMERITGFDAVADQNGFFVAYPDSVGPQWLLSGQNNDITFSEDLISVIEGSYHINATRVFLSGYSQGAGLAQQLAFCNAAQFAGVADISENLWPASQSVCQASRPLPYMLFHGTADPVSPYNGGVDTQSGVNSYSALKTAQTWAQIDGCPAIATPVATSIGDVLNDGSSRIDTEDFWGGCANGTNVTFYTIAGGGHTWPGGTQPAGSTLGPVSEDINASQIIWQAFNKPPS